MRFPGLPLRLLLDENTQPVSRAEINIDAFDLVACEAEELGVPETLSVFGPAVVGHKGRIAFDEDFSNSCRSIQSLPRQHSAK